MTKTLLGVSLLLSIGLYAEALDTDEQQVQSNEKTNTENSNQQVLPEEYYKTNQETSKNCETKSRGTYIEYHSNGMLKSFSIIH